MILASNDFGSQMPMIVQVPGERYSRNASCTLNNISTFLLDINVYFFYF